MLSFVNQICISFDTYFLCRIDELSKLNYAKDVELQSQRAQMEAMQVSVTVYRVLLVVKNLGWVDKDLG